MKCKNCVRLYGECAGERKFFVYFDKGRLEFVLLKERKREDEACRKIGVKVIN